MTKWNLDMVDECVKLSTECKCGEPFIIWIQRKGENIVKVEGGKLVVDEGVDEDLELDNNQFICSSCLSVLSITEVDDDEEEKEEEEENEEEEKKEETTETEPEKEEVVKDESVEKTIVNVHRPTGWFTWPGKK